ncbi:hypothetical protein DevBK_12370 [Devosia sp. BK]|uniref:hypothetical protein n=1 Tax=Devosia sp. BK TaxID=2871706 RepID=UPI0029395534|nr:hypothetical protein [Devosia sp. BK]MDV3252127.1 hypothetical protein [Devosia sp. BK]
MTETETYRSQLPALVTPAPARPSLASGAPTVEFISQLIAARDWLPPQRERRRASVDRAVGAYAQSAAIAVRRMPEGYRKTVVA